MSLISLVVALLIFCLLFWCVQRLLAAFGIGDPIATVVYIVFVLIFVLWLLGALTGASIGSLGSLRIH